MFGRCFIIFKLALLCSVREPCNSLPQERDALCMGLGVKAGGSSTSADCCLGAGWNRAGFACSPHKGTERWPAGA